MEYIEKAPCKGLIASGWSWTHCHTQLLGGWLNEPMQAHTHAWWMTVPGFLPLHCSLLCGTDSPHPSDSPSDAALLSRGLFHSLPPAWEDSSEFWRTVCLFTYHPYPPLVNSLLLIPSLPHLYFYLNTELTFPSFHSFGSGFLLSFLQHNLGDP